MSRIAFPGNTPNVTYTGNDGISSASTGIKLTYTCPAGFQALVLSVIVGPIAGGAPTIRAELNITSDIISINESATPFCTLCMMWINPGDSCRFNVITAVSGSTFAAAISVEEYPIG